MPDSLQLIFREIDQFFMQQGKVYETLQNVSRSLSKEGIEYAVIGGMALVIRNTLKTL